MKDKQKTRDLPTVDKAVKVAFAAVKDAEIRILALEYACRELRRESHYFGEALKDYSALHSTLYKRLNDAWSNLMMWTVVNPQDTEFKDAVAQMVWERYLSEGNEIMGYLDISKLPPSRYLVEDCNMFRGELNYLGEMLGIAPKKLPED